MTLKLIIALAIGIIAGLTCIGCATDGIQPIASVSDVRLVAPRPHVTTSCGVCAFGLCFLAGDDVTYNSPWNGTTTEFKGAGK